MTRGVAAARVDHQARSAHRVPIPSIAAAAAARPARTTKLHHAAPPKLQPRRVPPLPEPTKARHGADDGHQQLQQPGMQQHAAVVLRAVPSAAGNAAAASELRSRAAKPAPRRAAQPRGSAVPPPGGAASSPPGRAALPPGSAHQPGRLQPRSWMGTARWSGSVKEGGRGREFHRSKIRSGNEDKADLQS